VHNLFHGATSTEEKWRLLVTPLTAPSIIKQVPLALYSSDPVNHTSRHWEVSAIFSKICGGDLHQVFSCLYKSRVNTEILNNYRFSWTNLRIFMKNFHNVEWDVRPRSNGPRVWAPVVPDHFISTCLSPPVQLDWFMHLKKTVFPGGQSCLSKVLPQYMYIDIWWSCSWTSVQFGQISSLRVASFGILWGHGRLSLARSCRGTCHSHGFQTYNTDDVVVCSGQCWVEIW
jgi:hypothetical protein